MSSEIFSVGDAPVPFRKMCENRQHLCGGDRSVEVYPQGEWRELGTKPRPAVVRVQTEERAVELLDPCNMPEIQVIIGIEPDKQEERHQAYPAAAGTGKGASTDRQKRLLPLWLGNEVQEVLRGTNGYLLISADKPALQHRAKWPISRDSTFGAIQSGGMIAPAQTFGSSEREPSRATRLLLKKKCDKYLTIG